MAGKKRFGIYKSDLLEFLKNKQTTKAEYFKSAFKKVEEKKNKLNLELRSLLYIIDMIDGLKGEYPDYKENTLDEENFLDEQIKLVVEAKTRLSNIFRS